MGNSLLVVAEDREKLVGAYLVMPYELRINGSHLRCAQVVDNCILAGHRNQGLQRLMWARFMHSLLAEYDLAFGFPGKQAAQIGISQLGYEELAPFRELTLSLKVDQRQRPQHEFAYIPKFDRNHAAFFATKAVSGSVTVLRSCEYLNWRYLRVPNDCFESFEIRDLSKSLVGIAVFRIEGQRASIYELTVDSALVAIEDLYNSLSTYWMKRGILLLRTLMTPSHPTAALLRAMGAKDDRLGETKAVFFPSSERSHTLRSVEWHLILGDSDLR